MLYCGCLTQSQSQTWLKYVSKKSIDHRRGFLVRSYWHKTSMSTRFCVRDLKSVPIYHDLDIFHLSRFWNSPSTNLSSACFFSLEPMIDRKFVDGAWLSIEFKYRSDHFELLMPLGWMELASHYIACFFVYLIQRAEIERRSFPGVIWR